MMNFLKLNRGLANCAPVPALIIYYGAIWCVMLLHLPKKLPDSVSSNNVYKTFAEYRAAGTTETVAKTAYAKKAAYDGQTQFVIYGVDVTSPEFKEWDFILIRDLSASNLPDSYFDGLPMPLTKAVFAIRKSYPPSCTLVRPNS